MPTIKRLVPSGYWRHHYEDGPPENFARPHCNRCDNEIDSCNCDRSGICKEDHWPDECNCNEED